MSLYLSAAELSDLTGYRPNQFERIAAWLQQAHWPFVQPRAGACPRVLRAYHDQRLRGQIEPANPAATAPLTTPNRAALECLHRGRQKIAA